MSARYVELVVCAAPLARAAARLAANVVEADWRVSVITSTNAESWVDAEAIADAIGQAAITAGRKPDQPRTRARPSAVMTVPATFNTLNKLRNGISDTPALGVLNDAVGLRIPLLVVPMISERLTGHPAWPKTLTWLASTGVVVLDPQTGSTDGTLKPMPSGVGDAVTETFSGRLLVDWLRTID